MSADFSPEAVEARLKRLESVAGTASYYEFLGLKSNCEIGDISSAFQGLTKLLHPDRFHSPETRELRPRVERIYAMVLEAYRVLSDPKRRRKYHEKMGFAPPGGKAGGGATLGTTFKPKGQSSSAAPTENKGPTTRAAKARINRLRGKLVEKIKASKAKVIEGKNFLDEAKYDEAARCFQDAIAMDPRNAEASELLKKAREKKRGAEAERVFQEGRRMAGQSPNKALALFRQAISLRPDTARYHMALVSFLEGRLDDRQEIIEILREAVAIEPGNANIHTQLARNLTEEGIRGAARASWERVLQLKPNDKEATQALKKLK